MNALAIICRLPVESLCAFYNTFETCYDVFMIIDDEQFNYDQLAKQYTNISFIRLEKSKCLEKHYKNSSYANIQKEVTAWDKALYYFTYVRSEYLNVWFLEDDVFVYDMNTLLNIDKKYGPYDLLSNTVYKEAKLDEWMWSSMQIDLPPPYYCGMCCATRMSSNMLTSIKTYVQKYKTLFFLEACFPTIAKYFNLRLIDSPEELKTVTFNRQWDFPKDFNKSCIFHPIKNPDHHHMIRNHLYDA